MIPAERIHEWAAYLPPSHLGGGILVVGVLCGVGFGLVRARGALPRFLPGLLYLGLGAASASAWVGRSTTVTVAINAVLLGALWLHFRLGREADESVSPGRRSRPEGVSARGEFAPSIEDPFRPLPVRPSNAAVPAEMVEPTSWVVWLALVLGFAVVSLLLLDDLGGYAGTLLAWESPVVWHGFGRAIGEGIGLWQFVTDRFLWDDGVLSAGHTSLFFGPPTLALFKSVAATTWTLRVVSAAATLLAMAVLFSFVRRYYGAATALGAALLFGLSTPVLFYGRYGSSIAGTLLAVLLAIYATWSFLEGERGTLWRALLCGFALLIATLQYAPGRLAVLFLLGLIPCVLIAERRQPTGMRWIGFGLIVLMAAGVWSFETANGREQYFLHGRGEHVFGMFRNPNTIPALVGTTRKFDARKMSRAEKLEIVRMVVLKTGGELIRFVSPNPDPRARGAVVKYDPPPMTLYFAPVAVLAFLGLGRSLTRWRSWQYSAPLLFALAYSAVLLFTNRIDPHRGVLLVIPLALWFGLGANEVGRVARGLRVPTIVVAVLALAFAAAAVFSDVYIRCKKRPGVGARLEALVEDIDGISGPVSLWFALDHRELAWLELGSLDRQLRGGGGGRILPQALSDGLRSDKGGPRRIAIRQASRLAKKRTLLLGPRAIFLETVQKLQAQGLRVSEGTAEQYRYFRIDGGARRTGISDLEVPPLAPIQPPPPPAPVRLSDGPRVYLSDLEPDQLEYGFAEPRMDGTWQGLPVVMGGIKYPKAIGTHAWTRMRFRVPKDAIVFQAVVGLSDAVRACEAASVTFEVRGSDDSVLWESDVVDFATPPAAMEVPVVNQRSVVLVTTAADDGRDCDHANWGSAAFLLRKRAAAEDFPIVRGRAGAPGERQAK